MTDIIPLVILIAVIVLLGFAGAVAFLFVKNSRRS